MTKKIGYITQMFPHLSMTFVYREVEALRALGMKVQVFSTWRPSPEETPTDAQYLVDNTTYIFPVDWLRFAGRHIKTIAGNPGGYFGALALVLRGKHRDVKHRYRSFIHFCEAVHIAPEIKESDINHLHAHFAHNAATIAMVVSFLLDMPFSFTAHANDIFVEPLLLAEKLKRAEFIVAISQYNKSYLLQWAEVADQRPCIEVIHCGIDTDKFKPGAAYEEKDQAVILSVGRLVEKKGFVTLVRACKILERQGVDFQCKIFGFGPQEDSLKCLISELELSQNVILGGPIYQDVLPEQLKRAAIFTLPCTVAADGDMDGIPNSLMEAMAAGIPVVSTKLSGIPELIDNQVNGLLVTPGDEQELAEAMLRLLNDEARRKELGKAGREKVQNEFELRSTVSNLKQAFLGNLACAENEQ